MPSCRPRPCHAALACLLVVSVLSASGAALAARLDKQACEALRQEEQGLVTAGVKADMEKGPEWAKGNLPPERLQQIAKLIEIGEQLSFRCRVIAVPVKRRSPAAGPDKAAEPVAKAAAGAPPAAAASPAAEASPADAKKPAAIKLKPVNNLPPKRKPAATTVKKSAPKQTGLFDF